MQLETYISDLLYRYECVTIPQFGAFLTQTTSAKINSETQTFSPPKKMISFNQQLQNNDGLLARYISEVETITFEKATAKIATSVKAMRTLLTDGSTIEFNGVGTLILNAEGKLEFNPSYQLNYLTDSFGLSEVISPTITREVLKVVTEKTTPKTIVTPKVTTKASKKTTVLRPFYKYTAAAAILVLSVSSIFGTRYVNAIELENEKAQKQANHQLETQIQQATFVISNPLPTAVLTINKRTGKYHIIIGAHREKESALQQVKAFRDKGKDAWVENNKHGFYNVVYSSFNKLSEAQSNLEMVRDIYNPDAWLYVKELE